MQNITPDKNSNQGNADLPDSKKDQEKLQPEVVIMDMPEVQDIPGQENIRVPDLREMQDVTISSADEEAEDLLSEINTGPGSVNEPNSDIINNNKLNNKPGSEREDESDRTGGNTEELKRNSRH